LGHKKQHAFLAAYLGFGWRLSSTGAKRSPGRGRGSEHGVTGLYAARNCTSVLDSGSRSKPIFAEEKSMCGYGKEAISVEEIRNARSASVGGWRSLNSGNIGGRAGTQKESLNWRREGVRTNEVIGWDQGFFERLISLAVRRPPLKSLASCIRCADS
jgi:hypothetical protein